MTESICTPSLFDMSYLHQFDDHALKPHIIMEIGPFWFEIAFTKTLNLLRKFSNSPRDWLGERYKTL